MRLKMKLWLDDERDPKSPKIQSEFGSQGDEIWVKTASEAISYLSQNRVDSISLDHDLGHESAGTGMDVAKYIEEQAFHGKLKPLICFVHSKNPVGSKNMELAIINAQKFWSQDKN